jgi:hypothetical protein
VAAEAQDASAEAVIEDLEGGSVAAADVLDEPLVGHGGEQAARLRDAQGMRAWRGSGFHPSSIGNFAPW